MRVLRFQIRLPHGAIEQVNIESERVLIGSGGHCEIRLRYRPDLTQQNESLRAYTYTSARTALELALQWFPVFRSEPLALDDAARISAILRRPSRRDARHG